MPQTIPTDKARQGRSGRQVLTVLIVALILAAGAWAVAEFYGSQIVTPATEETTVPAN